jgi:outer membrane protein assembly factor BamD (BamD/ComL family)
LLPSAQKEVAELKRLADLNDQYSHALREMEAGNWYEARRLLETVHKSQTGYLETEKLLKKVENQIAREEQKRKQNDQVNTLYEQAHGLLRSKKWRNALDKMEEIRKLDEHFPDADGIAEKAKKELAREEQEAERQNKLAALYAEAVRLLKEEKYQEALDKWGEVRAVDPKYPDRQWVGRTAKKKLGGTRIPAVVKNDISLGKVFLNKESGELTSVQPRTVWLIMFLAVSWGIGRYSIEALARITNFFGLGLTFWATEIMLGSIGLLYGVTIWVLLRFLNVRIDRIKTILLLAGWLAGFLVVPVAGWSFAGLTNSAWDIGYTLAGLISAFCTGLVLRSLGILPNLKQFFILVTGLTVSIFAGEQIFDTLGLIKTVDIVSVEASPQFGVGSFMSGIFCAWIVTILAGEPQKRSRQQILFFAVLILLVAVGFLPQIIRDPFAGAVGQWTATDIGDNSHMTMSIERVFNNEYRFVFYDQHASACNGGPGTAQFSGRPIGNTVVSPMVFICTLNPDLRYKGEYAISYDADVNRLVDSNRVTWYRKK